MGRARQAQPGDFLRRMAAGSQQRFEQARTRVSAAKLSREISCLPVPPKLRLSSQGFDLIAEVKLRSPSAGQLAGENLDPVVQATRYAEGGAAALSVLTEPEQFSGDLDHLRAVTDAIDNVPAMRKDFIVDPYQIMEARAAGAGGVLLIAAILDAPRLRDMLSTALELDLFVLVEIFDEADLDHCVPLLEGRATKDADQASRLLLGVNCRDLRSLEVDFERFARLAPELPQAIPHVAESGVETPKQAAQVAALGYELALVGTALMRAGDSALATKSLLEAGRGLPA